MAVWFLSWNHQSTSERNPGASLGTGPYIKLDHLWIILEPIGAKTTGKSFSGTLDPASSKTTPEQLKQLCNFILMVNWWFGQVVWILGFPYKRVCQLGVPQFESQTTGSQIWFHCQLRKLSGTPWAFVLQTQIQQCDSRNPYGFPQGFFISYPEGKKQLPDSGCKIFHLTYCWMLQKSHKQPNHLTVWDVFSNPSQIMEISADPNLPSTGPIKAVLGVPEKSRDRQLWQLLVWVGRGLLVWRPCSTETFRWSSHHPLVLASTTVCVS